MKLYTKEQLKNFLKERTFIREETIDAMCDTLTPIELPSDEDIGKEIEKSIYSIEYDSGFIEGAKWIKEQILNQNKS